jgi:Zn-dependent protease
VLAFIFQLLTFGNGLIEVVGWIGFRINVFIALFNLLPFPPLDGSKVIEWDKKLWGLLILTTALLYIRM